MQYELKYKVIEPKRHTYQNIIDRFGDQPASRYQEATLDIEPRENFHYRPTWDAERELYDERYSALRLTDPYTFADPRQYYYTPYVTNRAGFHDEFGKTLGYLESRDLLAKMPDGWQTVLGTVVLPLRHYESGAQLVGVAGAVHRQPVLLRLGGQCLQAPELSQHCSLSRANGILYSARQ